MSTPNTYDRDPSATEPEPEPERDPGPQPQSELQIVPQLEACPGIELAAQVDQGRSPRVGRHQPAPETELEPAPAPAPEPELDGQIVGEYVVEGTLGSGAFGTVYKAVHPLIGKVVAIKVLSRRFSADPEMVSRFVAEARAVNQIRHRNIIDIFSFGQLEDGRHYYVMELPRGRDAAALLDRERRGSSPARRRWRSFARSVARSTPPTPRASPTATSRPRTSSWATDSDGGLWPKLLDFGIAKLISPEDGFAHKTRSGIVDRDAHSTCRRSSATGGRSTTAPTSMRSGSSST